MLDFAMGYMCAVFTALALSAASAANGYAQKARKELAHSVWFIHKRKERYADILTFVFALAAISVAIIAGKW